MKHLALTIIILLFFSCDDTQYIRKYSIPKISSIKNEFNIQSSQHSDLPFSWSAPDSWEIKEENTMGFVVGKYKIPYHQKDAELSISYFKGNVGGLVQNVNRWRSQIFLEALTLDEINEITTRGNSPIGAYKMFKIINKSNLDRGLLCFMISINQNTIVVKLDCSVETLQFLEDDIKNFVNTFKYNR